MNIAFLAHDKKKELMVQFCTAYKSVLTKHNLYATATTGRLIADNTGLPVTLLLSLESVFAVLTGLAFGDAMTVREWLGCVLMFAAVVLAQLPWPPSLKDINQKM